MHREQMDLLLYTDLLPKSFCPIIVLLVSFFFQYRCDEHRMNENLDDLILSKLLCLYPYTIISFLIRVFIVKYVHMF